MFPPEIIDHVLSFLQWDHFTLSVCAKAHPSLLKLVERHLYAHLTIQHSNPLIRVSGACTPSDLLKHIVDNPNIAKYVRSLRLYPVCYNDGDYRALKSILPALTELQTISLSSITGTRWNGLLKSFRTSFTNCLRLPSLTHVNITKIDGFPLSALDHSSQLKRLSLFGGFCCASPASSLVYPQLDSLVLSYCFSSVDIVASWAKCRSLRSLEYQSDLSRILGGCANTLTTLKVHIPLHFCTRNSYSTPFNPIPFSLACLPHLARLTLRSPISFRRNTWCEYSDSCLPAIMYLLDTLPSPPTNLVLLVFAIDFDLTDTSDISDTDWSPLISFPYFDVIPSIELRVCAKRGLTQIPPVELLNKLKENPHLMQLESFHSLLINAVEEPGGLM